MDDAIACASAAVRSRTAADLAALAEGRPAGVALGRLLVTRMPDYRTNLVARALMSDDEAETYVRHNVRSLGAQYPPEQAWRLLLRYLFEYQYLLPALGLTRVADPRTFLFSSTGIADELFHRRRGRRGALRRSRRRRRTPLRRVCGRSDEARSSHDSHRASR